MPLRQLTGVNYILWLLQNDIPVTQIQLNMPPLNFPSSRPKVDIQLNRLSNSTSLNELNEIFRDL